MDVFIDNLLHRLDVLKRLAILLDRTIKEEWAKTEKDKKGLVKKGTNFE